MNAPHSLKTSGTTNEGVTSYCDLTHRTGHYSVLNPDERGSYLPHGRCLKSGRVTYPHFTLNVIIFFAVRLSEGKVFCFFTMGNRNFIEYKPRSLPCTPSCIVDVMTGRYVSLTRIENSIVQRQFSVYSMKQLWNWNYLAEHSIE
jgi:hypothetical protein